jgi:Flp pilus assembly protein TadG
MDNRCDSLVLQRKLHASPRRRARQSGSVLVEFSLVILPLMAMMFLLLDTAWLFFAKSSMEEAVREAVRAGITGKLQTGTTGLTASMRKVAQYYAPTFLTPSNVSSLVNVNYYAPTDLSTSLSGCSATNGGNVVRVSISGLSLVPLAPLWRSPAAISLSATAADVMEPGNNNACP